LDNVTHSLAGMLLAETALVSRRESRPRLRAIAYLASVLANNLPDSDIVYTWITGPKPLGSLLHHRGHTHTLLLALPMAWLLGLALWRWYSRRNADASQRDQNLILGLCLVGPLLHLTMDLGNNYGVHPFWPFSGRWFYGDTIFIVEPLWWAIAIPILAQVVKRSWLKVLLWLLLGAVLVASWLVPFVLPASRWALIAISGLSFVVGRRASEQARIGFALVACSSVAVCFGVCSNDARKELRHAAAGAFPALSPSDIVLSPMPANPLCWEGLLVGEQGGSYRVLRASVAVWPLQASSCTAGLDVEPTANVRALERPNRGGVRWISEYREELSELRQLAQRDCRFRALLQFARLPYISRHGSETMPGRDPGKFAGDLRYDRKPGLDFSDLSLPEDPSRGPCPRFLTAWTPPRADLLQP
jgi:inner membrane protein